MMNDSLPNNASHTQAATGPSPVHASMDQLESLAAGLSEISTDAAPTRPTVEVIGEQEMQATPMASQQSDGGSQSAAPSPAQPPREISINCSVEFASNLVTGALGSTEPIPSETSSGQSNATQPLPLNASESTGADGLHEFDLAINGLADPGAFTATENNQPLVVDNPPPAQIDLASNQPVFDVRDFADAQGKPELLPNSFTVDPEAFEYHPPTIQQIVKVDHDVLIASAGMGTAPPPDQVPIPRFEPLKDSAAEASFESKPVAAPAAQATLNSASTSNEPATDSLGKHEELFLADDGQIIEIDGSDGFETIDLQYYDVACAKFSPNQILVDDGQGMSFRIRYQNIPKAIFANGCEILL